MYKHNDTEMRGPTDARYYDKETLCRHHNHILLALGLGNADIESGNKCMWTL